MNKIELKQTALRIRQSIVETAYVTQKGHLLSSFSIVEILTCLYYKILRIDCDFKDDRDYFILSKGHACLALYCVLSDLNFFSKDELLKFCKIDGILGGHPSRMKVKGIEASTGSLGHGPSIGLGIALSLRLKKSDKQVFILVGDGECNEGSVWEAALSANKHKLDNYWIIVDYNHYQSYSTTDEICPLDPLSNKWESFGFNCRVIDMKNDPFSFLEAYEELKNANGPKCIICDGIKGLGSKSLEGNLQYHHVKSLDLDFKNIILKEIEN